MNKKILFHGSRFKITGFLEPRQAGDASHKDNALLGVYATDRFACAAGMALTGESPSFSDYREEEPKVVFMHRGPKPEKVVYVYEIPADSFVETSEKHQFVSEKKVPILRTHVFTAKELRNCWRFATEQEFNSKWEKFGYPAAYKEFFQGKFSRLSYG